MTSLPLVSIIIPIYNHANFVKQSLNSVFNQTYPSLEIIIIDDGSKDKSPEIIENLICEWNKKNLPGRYIIFKKQANQGAHNTINLGLSLSTGHYLTILNSDDFYDLNRVEIIVKKLQNQNAKWAFTEVHGIDNYGNPLPLDHYWKTGYETNLWSSCLQVTIGFQLLIDNITVSTGNLFFSREIYEKVGNFSNYKLAHDYDFALRALVFAEPLFIQERLYFYRMHQSNTLHKVNHLAEQEKKAIYLNYVLQVAEKPPENKKAPSNWYWPLIFPKFRSDYHLDRGLLSGLETPLEETTSTPFSLVKNIKEYSSSSKKITLITHSLCYSGAPKVVLDFAKLLQKQNYKVNLISLADGPLRADFENLGINVCSVPQNLRFWYSEPTKYKKIKSLLKLMKLTFFKTQKTVIANCAVSWPLLFPLAYFFPSKKFFWYIHDSFSPAFMIGPGAGMRLFNKIKDKANLKVFFGSDNTRKIWKEGISGVVKYWSGFSLQKSLETKKTVIKNILFVGSITPRKAPHDLVEAFIYCHENKMIPEDVTITLIGFDEIPKDCYLYELLMKKNKAGLYQKIRYLKNLNADNLPKYFEEADLYIQPSVTECLPISLLQAMSCGLPIITTDVNGCVEAIENQVSGYVCSSRDSLELAKTIAMAINNPKKSFEMGLKAQSIFNEKFALEKTWPLILNEFKDQ